MCIRDSPITLQHYYTIYTLAAFTSTTIGTTTTILKLLLVSLQLHHTKTKTTGSQDETIDVSETLRSCTEDESIGVSKMLKFFGFFSIVQSRRRTIVNDANSVILCVPEYM